MLDADIAGCFDNIDHEALLKELPVFTETIASWRKAGVVELGGYTHSESGTRQGGIVSPRLANIALTGMERLFAAERKNGAQVAPSMRSGKDKGIRLIRYADDFVIIAPS